MRTSKILYNGGNPKIRQTVSIICDKCNESHTFPKYTSYISGLSKYGRDLCLKCRRELQYFKAGEAAKDKMKGKKYSDFYTKEQEEKIKKSQSKSSRGKNNPMYGNIEHTEGLVEWNKNLKGKTFEEIYGDRAPALKKRISQNTRGTNNPMYGRPSPIGSGNGWSGWYNGWYFRSFHELSYMINVIERFGFKWESAEKQNYGISYLDKNLNPRTYYADFIINEKYLVEIKPKSLHSSSEVILKSLAAERFCSKNLMIYKLIDPSKLLSDFEIKELIISNKIKLINRYQKKYKEWQEN